MTFAAALLLALTPAEGLARLAKDDGIEIVVLRAPVRIRRDGYAVAAEGVPETVLAAYAPILDAEWRRYPASFMRYVGLKRIVIGSKVRVEDQPRAAVPEFDQGWLWLDAEVGSRLPNYGRRSLHHDFFHMVDRRMNPGQQGRDPAWAALNPPNVRYGNGGWWMQKGDVGRLRADLPGFLTAYSTSAVEEDKAEVFSHLLCDPAFVAERAAADPVMRVKVGRLKSTLLDFDPDISPSWWPKAPPALGSS